MQRTTALVLALGIGFLLVGGLQLLPVLIHSPQALGAVALCAATAGSGPLVLALRDWRQEKRLQEDLFKVSTEAAQWIPVLYGNYMPYVVEAAERLGAARETTAVPALLHVLERTLHVQPPGWHEAAEAMVTALGKMGDRRALPLLQRLWNVREGDLLAVAQEAIDRLEPETSLLRPGSADSLPGATLLRPTVAAADADPATLLRADNGRSCE
jgi:hypothetical protein